VAEPGHRVERSPYQGASIFFAGVVILFAIAGMAKTLLSGDGVGSAGFLICLLFLALGLGRLYLGLRPEGGPVEGAEPHRVPPPAERQERHKTAGGSPRARRTPSRRRRP
jgi:hypothetical protein